MIIIRLPTRIFWKPSWKPKKKEVKEFLSKFYDSGAPSLRELAILSEKEDFTVFRPAGRFTKAHAALEQDVEAFKANAVDMLCKGDYQDIMPRLYKLNDTIRSILDSREAGSAFTSTIDTIHFNLSKPNSRDQYIREKMPEMISRAVNAVVGDLYRKNDVEGARRVLTDLNRLVVSAANTRKFSIKDLENDSRQKEISGQVRKGSAGGGRTAPQQVQQAQKNISGAEDQILKKKNKQ